MQPTIAPLGDTALTVTFGTLIDEEINNKVFSFFTHLEHQSCFGVRDIIPAYASVTVVYDLLLIKQKSKGPAYEYMYRMVKTMLENFPVIKTEKRKAKKIPVCYDPSVGFDLYEMATQKKISIDDIIQLHVTKRYRVYMIGFLPGFAYMGAVDKRIATPRKETPRTGIPAGSVGIAGEQTGIYPLDSPGGWNIIGRTPIKLFNADLADPCFLQPGDLVEFQPISLREFNQIKNHQ